MNSEVQQLGGSILAVSVEKPDHSLSLVEKHELSFPVLSDVKAEVIQAYRVAWEFSKELQEGYLKYFKLNLTEWNQSPEWILPIPATFIIDTQHKIRFRFVQSDYTKRAEPSQLLNTLKNMIK